MNWDKVYSHRLTLLVDHLENGTLGMDKFFFGEWFQLTPCGTAGCAAAECVTIFPNNWSWASHCENRFPRLIDSDLSTRASLEQWFWLDIQEMLHLFMPGEQSPRLYGGKMLARNATRYEVASNIREFLKYKATRQENAE